MIYYSAKGSVLKILDPGGNMNINGWWGGGRGGDRCN